MSIHNPLLSENSSQLRLDLRHNAFSRCGSYLTIVRRVDLDPVKAGLFIRSLHGGASPREIFSLEILYQGESIPFKEIASPALLRMQSDHGYIDFVFESPEVIRIKGKGVGLRLYKQMPADEEYSAEYPFLYGENRIQINANRSRMQYLVTVLSGNYSMNAPWSEVRCPTMQLDFQPDSTTDILEMAFEEFEATWIERTYPTSFEACLKTAETEFQRWMALSVGNHYLSAEAFELAVYTQYSSVVKPSGMLKRPSMFMSSYWMANLWGWDHCFNAMALIYKQPKLAWDQYMALFDHQDEFGMLPDYVNDREVWRNFTKPPIHGWALRWMMDRSDSIGTEQLEEIYPKLGKWANFWMIFRDYNKNGIPQYNHGNDGGWDNATIFLEPGAVESPDLAAYVICVMDVLTDIAEKLGLSSEAHVWKQRADELLARMIEYFWVDERFVARRDDTGEIIHSDSLTLTMPIILGDRLPAVIRDGLVKQLSPEGMFLTDWGLATEWPKSTLYQEDGYWRGPIWAPAVMIAIDGLKRAGAHELAAEISRRFCRTCSANKMAENFNARTGEGLRDQSYTWTASVFLILAHEYAGQKTH